MTDIMSVMLNKTTLSVVYCYPC